MLSCAGVYVSGAAGSNECPAGSVRIETEAACRTAAAAAGKTFSFVETYSNFPRGCIYDYNDYVAAFNTHAVGAGHFRLQLLCAAIVTYGAPLHASPPVRACRTARVLTRVFTEYSKGTQRRVLTRYSQGTRRALKKTVLT